MRNNLINMNEGDLNMNKNWSIAVLNRGWVVIGRMSQHGVSCMLDDSFVIRRWGTTEGLGQLIDGPTENTILDYSGRVRYNELTSVMNLEVDNKVWDKYYKENHSDIDPVGETSWRISILNRGWIVIGEFSNQGVSCFVDKAYVIRRWGTTAGLGQLINGPTDQTILDYAGKVRFNELTSVMMLDVNDQRWNEEHAKRMALRASGVSAAAE